MRYVAVVNPTSGGGRASSILERLRQIGRHLEIEVLLTQYAGHATDIVKQLDPQTVDALIVLGGDGTIHEVVNGVMAHPASFTPPLAILPGGTGNSLAHDLGCVCPESAFQKILRDHRQALDLICVSLDGQRRYAFNLVGLGLVATAGRLAESLRWLGPIRYRIASVIKILTSGAQALRLDTGERKSEGRFSMVAACNTQHIGTGMRLAPDAALDDGMMDLLVLESCAKMTLLRLLRRLDNGAHVDSEALIYLKTRRVSIQLARRGMGNVDGENLHAQDIDLEVVPAALQVIA